jgi:hypothetical protein
MVFGMEISKIFWTGLPIDKELVLADTVFDPVKTHVDGFGYFLFDCVVCKSGHSGVVGLHGCGWSGVAKFVEREANWLGFLSIEK